MRHRATDGFDCLTNRCAILNTVVDCGIYPPMCGPPSSNSRWSCFGLTFATIASALRNSDPWWRPTAAFALSKSTILVRGMTGQQLPVELYRIGTTTDEILSRVNAINAICCVMWDKSGGPDNGALSNLQRPYSGHLHINEIVC
jgi:hypothetical protein